MRSRIVEACGSWFSLAVPASAQGRRRPRVSNASALYAAVGVFKKRRTPPPVIRNPSAGPSGKAHSIMTTRGARHSRITGALRVLAKSVSSAATAKVSKLATGARLRRLGTAAVNSRRSLSKSGRRDSNSQHLAWKPGLGRFHHSHTSPFTTPLPGAGTNPCTWPTPLPLWRIHDHSDWRRP